MGKLKQTFLLQQAVNMFVPSVKSHVGLWGVFQPLVVAAHVQVVLRVAAEKWEVQKVHPGEHTCSSAVFWKSLLSFLWYFLVKVCQINHIKLDCSGGSNREPKPARVVFAFNQLPALMSKQYIVNNHYFYPERSVAVACVPYVCTVYVCETQRGKKGGERMSKSWEQSGGGSGLWRQLGLICGFIPARGPFQALLPVTGWRDKLCSQASQMWRGGGALLLLAPRSSPPWPGVSLWRCGAPVCWHYTFTRQ